jgi:hypothetical protein
LIKWSEHVNMFMYFLVFNNMFDTHIFILVFMKWFVAMQIVGGKMDDSSKGRTWGKKCKFLIFYIFLHGLFVDCMDSLNHFFLHLEKCVCVWFFFTSSKVFWSIKLSKELWFWTISCSSFFSIFFIQWDNFTTKGSRRHGF